MKEVDTRHKSKTFYCETEISDKLDHIAKYEDVSASQILRKVTKQYVTAWFRDHPDLAVPKR